MRNRLLAKPPDIQWLAIFTRKPTLLVNLHIHYVCQAKQSAAAKRNIKKAARAAKAKRTVAHLPKATRTALGKKGAKAAKRKRSKK